MAADPFARSPAGVRLVFAGFAGILNGGVNYVAAHARAWLEEDGRPGQVAEEPWMRSDLRPRHLMLPWASAARLDREAAAKAAEGVPIGAWADGRRRRVKLILVCPKTAAPLPPPSADLDLDVLVLWSDLDPIWNQGWFRPNDQVTWERYAPGRTFNVDPGARGLAAHARFDLYCDGPPIRSARGNLGGGLIDLLFPRRTPRSAPRAPGLRALARAWAADAAIDAVLIAHSQGCNIALHALARACAAGWSAQR